MYMSRWGFPSREENREINREFWEMLGEEGVQRLFKSEQARSLRRTQQAMARYGQLASVVELRPLEIVIDATPAAGPEIATV
jgi:hypothetical protein